MSTPYIIKECGEGRPAVHKAASGDVRQGERGAPSTEYTTLSIDSRLICGDSIGSYILLLSHLVLWLIGFGHVRS